MRRAVLAILAVVLLVTAPLAFSAFWAGRALTDSEGYASRMQDAWLHGGIRSEFGSLVASGTQQQLYEAFGVSGPGQSGLADLALQFVTNRIDAALASGEFVQAWGDWHQQLHEDLAAIATGGTGQSTTVEGSVMRVDISPLVSALLAGSFGNLALQALGEDMLVQQIDTGYDMQAQLTSFGSLWGSRWWSLTAAVGTLLLMTLLARPRLRGAGLGLLAAAAGCLAAGVWRLVAIPAPQGEAPLLSAAITDALLAGWAVWLFAAAGVLVLAGGALVLLGRPAPATMPRGADVV